MSGKDAENSKPPDKPGSPVPGTSKDKPPTIPKQKFKKYTSDAGPSTSSNLRTGNGKLSKRNVATGKSFKRRKRDRVQLSASKSLDETRSTKSLTSNDRKIGQMDLHGKSKSTGTLKIYKDTTPPEEHSEEDLTDEHLEELHEIPKGYSSDDD